MNGKTWRTLLVAAGLLASGSVAAYAASLPGTQPTAGPRIQRDVPAALQPRAADGLKVFYRKYDRLSLSVDAAGSNAGSQTVTVKKPSRTAKVEKAFLLAASYGVVPIDVGDITLEGTSVTWMAGVTNDLPSYPDFFHNVVGDVTSIVKRKIDAAPAGDLELTIAEVADTNSIDGEILVVVFKDPKLKTKNTVALLFGGQQILGDRFEIGLGAAINPASKSAKAEMGLGISYSYQANATQQYSQVDVNGSRLSTASGGEDDGSPENGGLITVGGVGDDPKNPDDPNATPVDARSDDEYYNMLPFITRTDRIIRVETLNPSNDDNIFFAWFNLSANADINKDTDGDGLLDVWEQKGYDHDGDGEVDVPLNKMGANYRKKDIFIGYAWMEKSASETKSHQPSNKVLNLVTQAFARAPVSNPNGTKGITIHWISKGAVAHDDDLNEVWGEFDGLMNPLFTEAERVVMHRMLNGHGYGGNSSSGLSRDIPASDFIETLGLWSTNPGTDKQRAGTIMHELGHNLGLRHGGVDHENYKPNHLSIMSYFNQMDWLTKSGRPYLDYEQFNLKDLDENALDETKGLDRVGGDGPLAVYGVRWYSGGVGQSKANKAGSLVDWDANGNPRNKPVAVDLNNSGALSVLRAGYPEWTNIIYDGGDIGAGIAAGDKASMLTKPADLDELTFEEYQEKILPQRR